MSKEITRQLAAIVGRPDKPFHRPECNCRECEAWKLNRAAQEQLLEDQEQLLEDQEQLLEELKGDKPSTQP